MNALDELEEIKELVNADKKFKYKNIVNFNCDNIKEELNYASNCHNLEEQIGCPLEVVFKALKEGIYYKFIETDCKLNKMIVPMSRIIDDKYCWTCPKWTSTTLMNVKLKDYKKTWWLKEDMSE